VVLPFRRWAALLALLVAEGLALGIAFDSDALDGLPPSFALFLVRNAGSAVRVGSVILACLVLVAGPRIKRGVGPDSAWAGPLTAHRYRPYLLAHLATYAILALVTALLYGHAAPPARAGALVGAWLALLPLTLGTWALTLVPPRMLPALARRHGGAAALAAALGGTALGVGKLSQGLWFPLRKLTFALSSSALGLFVRDPVSDAATLAFGTRAFVVDIAPLCSGYEGMGLTAVFLLAALWFFRDRLRFPRAWWLLPAGAAVSFVANIARLVALVLVGTYVSPEIGQGGFHSYAGTLLFCGLALSIIALAVRSPVFSTAAASGGGSAPVAAAPLARERNPVAPYLVPFLAMIAAGLVARSFSSPGHEPLYALRPLVGAGALAAYWPVYRRREGRPALPWRASWLAPAAGALVAALWLAFAKVTGPVGPPIPLATVSAPALALRLLTTALIVPSCEELAFRGFLARRLTSAAFEAVPGRALTPLAIGVSSLAFGLLHARAGAGILAGVAYALTYRARGRLADAALAHATTNALLLAAAVWAGDLSLAT
jgi:exosortase E/protease (VPEID-CTERM system)